jgi:hypothetical protein
MLYVSFGPKRLMQSEFAEPVGIGAIGILRTCLASLRAARPFKTSYTRPSPDAVAMTLKVRPALAIFALAATHS